MLTTLAARMTIRNLGIKIKIKINLKER